MIIVLCGEMGVGKSTVARIMKVLTENPTTKLEVIRSYALDKNEESFLFLTNGWEVKKISLKLKEFVSNLIGCEVEKLEDRSFKESSLGEKFNNKSPRDLLQYFGQKAKETLGDDFWIKSLIEHYKPDSKWIIEDLRFKEELDYINLYTNPIIISVNSKLCTRIKREVELPIHNITEEKNSFIKVTPDYIINNDSEFKDLVNQVKFILKHLQYDKEKGKVR